MEKFVISNKSLCLLLSGESTFSGSELNASESPSLAPKTQKRVSKKTQAQVPQQQVEVETLPLPKDSEEQEFAENLELNLEPNADEFQSSEYDYELAPNQALITLSLSLMNQAKSLSRMEGISFEDMLIELLSEGIARRSFEDSHRQMPSHLMTRTGYLPPEATPQNSQPSLSHHMGYSNGNRNSRPNSFGNSAQRPQQYNGYRQQNGQQNKQNFRGNKGQNFGKGRGGFQGGRFSNGE
jgi:hypothetical protein